MLGEQVAHKGAGHGIRAPLRLPIAGEEPVDLLGGDGRGKRERDHEARAILQPPRALHEHRQALVKPARHGLAARGAVDQHVRDFVAEDILERVVGIRGRPRREQHDHAGPAVGQPGGPVGGTPRGRGVLAGEYHHDRRSRMVETDEPHDARHARGVERLHPRAGGGHRWRCVDLEHRRRLGAEPRRPQQACDDQGKESRHDVLIVCRTAANRKRVR